GQPQPGQPSGGQRVQAPSPESGWTPAVSGAVRAPVEPGTLPPGVIAPVTEVPPAGTFVPTGSMPIVRPGTFPGVTAQRTAGVPSAPGGAGAVGAPSGQSATGSFEDDGTATPAWGSLGIVATETEVEEPEQHRGYTWLHMIVL